MNKLKNKIILLSSLLLLFGVGFSSFYINEFGPQKFTPNIIVGNIDTYFKLRYVNNNFCTIITYCDDGYIVNNKISDTADLSFYLTLNSKEIINYLNAKFRISLSLSTNVQTSFSDADFINEIALSDLDYSGNITYSDNEIYYDFTLNKEYENEIDFSLTFVFNNKLIPILDSKSYAFKLSIIRL